MTQQNFENKLIEVCDNCLQSSCWLGIFMCDNAFEAGTVLKTVAELRKLALEHESYWCDDLIDHNYGTPAPYGYSNGMGNS